MSDIKSAFEIAMEKMKDIGEVTEAERFKWRYVPEGEKLAARYIREDYNLVAELAKYEEIAKEYVVAGAAGVLVKNINLPRDELVQKNNKRAMDCLKTLKRDKVGVENVYSRIRHIFDHYVGTGEQQRKQTFEALKQEFAVKIQQAVQQQMGSLSGVKIDVEKQPQFKEEWRRALARMDDQYLQNLDELKQELSAID
jgi:hypothetical protein